LENLPGGAGRPTTGVDDENIFFPLLTILGKQLILYPPSGNNVRSIKAAYTAEPFDLLFVYVLSRVRKNQIFETKAERL